METNLYDTKRVVGTSEQKKNIEARIEEEFRIYYEEELKKIDDQLQRLDSKFQSIFYDDNIDTEERKNKINEYQAAKRSLKLEIGELKVRHLREELSTYLDIIERLYIAPSTENPVDSSAITEYSNLNALRSYDIFMELLSKKFDVPTQLRLLKEINIILNMAKNQSSEAFTTLYLTQFSYILNKIIRISRNQSEITFKEVELILITARRTYEPKITPEIRIEEYSFKNLGPYNFDGYFDKDLGHRITFEDKSIYTLFSVKSVLLYVHDIAGIGVRVGFDRQKNWYIIHKDGSLLSNKLYFNRSLDGVFYYDNEENKVEYDFNS